jgi:Flp pilus assembly pilin Flp
MIQHFFCEEDGQTLVEYGFIIALIALVVISAVTLFGARVKSALYDKAITKITN